MGTNNNDRFAELEYGLQHYFSAYLAPVMGQVKAEVETQTAGEMKRYNRSAQGVLSAGSDPTGAHFQLGLDSLKVTGEWSSQTTEDYLDRVKERINGSEAVQKDLLVMAGEWREAVVQRIGPEKYQALSKELGCDLAYAYVDHRMEQLMVERLVKEHMPQSTVDYILHKAAGGSLFGLNATLGRSPLAAEIEARSEKAYRPTIVEKGVGKVLGAGIDAVATGGAGTWTSLAKFVGMDMAVSSLAASVSPSPQPASASVEDCLSKCVFSSKKNVFDGFRRQASLMKADESGFLVSLNGRMTQKLRLQESELARTDWEKAATPVFQSSFQVPAPEKTTYRTAAYTDKGLPVPVASGQEKEYLDYLAQEQQKADAAAGTRAEADAAQAVSSGPSAGTADSLSGWDGLLKNFGLDGIGGWAGNLGYVLAMLPDVLLGAFTGKSASLGLKDNLLPMASIIGGLFVKNPLLKMLMIGLGGANLANKCGKEAMQLETGVQESAAAAKHYRTYDDEPLDPRIAEPVLQGNCLIATIDRVPCSIVLPTTVVDAYRQGALPLNTLANAVLQKCDSMNGLAQERYEAGQERIAENPEAVRSNTYGIR